MIVKHTLNLPGKRRTYSIDKEIGQDFKKLKQMVLLEEFKDKVRPYLFIYLCIHVFNSDMSKYGCK